MIALNSVMAAQLIEFKQEIDAKMGQGMKMEEAVLIPSANTSKRANPSGLKGTGTATSGRRRLRSGIELRDQRTAHI